MTELQSIKKYEGIAQQVEEENKILKAENKHLKYGTIVDLKTQIAQIEEENQILLRQSFNEVFYSFQNQIHELDEINAERSTDLLKSIVIQTIRNKQ
jgi:hypothetical protein